MTTSTIIKISAAAVVVDVIAVYFYSLGTKGVYPPVHPWSAITLLGLSIGPMGGWRNREAPPPVVSWLVLVAVLLSATLWTVSALLPQ